MWSFTMEVMKHIFVSVVNTWQARYKFKLPDLITGNGELVQITYTPELSNSKAPAHHGTWINCCGA
jgi:hypothetical protein